MRKFEEWLAASATGSFVKITLGAALGAALSWLTTADIHPLIVAISAAVIPIIINTVNPEDPRYGTVNWDDFDE
jgi:ATP/ADP translocase